MIIKALIAQSQSRATGYVSLKSRQAVIDRLYQEGVIDMPVSPMRYVVQFRVTGQLSYVEQALIRGRVSYVKLVEEQIQ